MNYHTVCIDFFESMSAFDISSVNSAGVLAFEASGLLETLKTNMASTSADTAIAAMGTIKKLCEECDQWIEPYLVSALPAILDNLAAPKTATAASETGNAILKKSNSHSVRVITTVLYESFTSMKWQTKKGESFYLSIYYFLRLTHFIPSTFLSTHSYT